jgi:hypothetical protein
VYVVELPLEPPLDEVEAPLLDELDPEASVHPRQFVGRTEEVAHCREQRDGPEPQRILCVVRLHRLDEVHALPVPWRQELAELALGLGQQIGYPTGTLRTVEVQKVPNCVLISPSANYCLHVFFFKVIGLEAHPVREREREFLVWFVFFFESCSLLTLSLVQLLPFFLKKKVRLR